MMPCGRFGAKYTKQHKAMMAHVIKGKRLVLNPRPSGMIIKLL